MLGRRHPTDIAVTNASSCISQIHDYGSSNADESNFNTWDDGNKKRTTWIDS